MRQSQRDPFQSKVSRPRRLVQKIREHAAIDFLIGCHSSVEHDPLSAGQRLRPFAGILPDVIGQQLSGIGPPHPNQQDSAYIAAAVSAAPVPLFDNGRKSQALAQ